MRMKDTDFLTISTYIRVQEKQLLDKAGLDRVADTPTPQEALRVIGQNSGLDFSTLRRPEDYEGTVKQSLREAYRTAYALAESCPALPGILGCRYDYHNVKVALKAKFLGEPGGPFADVTPVPAELIEKTVQKYDSKANLPAHLHEAILAGAAAFERDSNPQDIDIALDKLQYAHMLAQAEQLGSGFITGYVRRVIDFYNLKALVRVKSMQKGSAFLGECLAPGGGTDPAFFLQNYGRNAGALSLAFAFKDYGKDFKAGIDAFEKSSNYSELERLLDNHLIRYVQDAKRVPFGPEVLFSYLVAKENEVRQVRIVMACKINGIPTDTLKERLRDNYV